LACGGKHDLQSKKPCELLGKLVEEESSSLTDEVDLSIIRFGTLKKIADSPTCFIPLSSDQAVFLNQKDETGTSLWALHKGIKLFELEKKSYLTFGEKSVRLCDFVMDILNRPVSPTFTGDDTVKIQEKLKKIKKRFSHMVSLVGKRKDLEDEDGFFVN
jgi:hypothetical protein